MTSFKTPYDHLPLEHLARDPSEPRYPRASGNPADLIESRPGVFHALSDNPRAALAMLAVAGTVFFGAKEGPAISRGFERTLRFMWPAPDHEDGKLPNGQTVTRGTGPYHH